jgi:hypothetical protein
MLRVAFDSVVAARSALRRCWFASQPHTRFHVADDRSPHPQTLPATSNSATRNRREAVDFFVEQRGTSRSDYDFHKQILDNMS